MTREYLVKHLIDSGCYEVEQGRVEGVSELWQNSVNGQQCYIDLEHIIELKTYCYIFKQLQIDPPLENGYDSDYAVYSSM